MKRLSYIGYVGIERSTLDKRTNFYVPLEKGEKKVGIEGILKDPTSLRQDLENSFDMWLKNIVGKEKENKGEKIHLLSEASLHKFDRLENNVRTTSITIEDLQHIIKADTNLKYANLKLFPFSSQAIPTLISKEDSSQKSKTSSEIEGKGNNPALSDNSGDRVCALCDSANGDLMKDFTRLTWEQLKDFPIGEEWQSANKNVLLHKACFQDLYCRGYSLEDIALRIKEYERIRGKAYFLHLKDVSDLFENPSIRYR
jgi:hypothetical protein